MERVIIIGEAGVNHNGDINLAYQLIDIAAEAKVDYVKFQTFVTELLVDKSAQKADYQVKNMNEEGSQFDMIKKLELPFEVFTQLKAYSEKKGIKFLTSFADLVTLEYVRTLDLDYIKVASGEITNIPFLKKVATMNKPIILSTGMANLGDIENALTILTNCNVDRSDITILHCNTEYPTPLKDVNLKAMNTIADAFKVKVGYSDHTLGIEVSIAAVALGARVIEKHFTISKSLPGPDHLGSLEPNELKELVNSIRNTELAISGNSIKEPSESERKNIPLVRKSIFTIANLKTGDIITADNIYVKRPGNGIPAENFELLIGKTVNRDIPANCKLYYSDIVW